MKHKWINLLHFYLPPTSEQIIVDEAVNKSYSWILEMARKNPNWRFTINFNACLVELLKTKHQNIINEFKDLIQNKQIELVDTLAFHHIAPLFSEKHIIRQIKINQQINQKFFNSKARGFFLPEMAYSQTVGKIIDKLGYDWLILDEISNVKKPDENIKYQLRGGNLKIIYRSRDWSKTYPPLKIIKQKNNLPKIIISATDAELYGLRFVDWEGWLQKTLNLKNIQCLTISEYLKELKQIKEVNPIASNWESSKKEIDKTPFYLWFNKKNRIQIILWKLAKLALKEIDKNKNDKNFYWAQRHLDRGLASCTFWWASEKDFELFGAPAWKPDEVEKGATELVKVIRTLKVPTRTKLLAEKYYHKIKKLLWTKHWKKYDK